MDDATKDRPHLPVPSNLDEYRSLFHKEGTWRRAVRVIASRHGLAALPPRRVMEGTHIVTLLGATHAVKLFTPLFPRDAVVEAAAMQEVGGKLPVPTPEIVATGELDGWDYIVMTQVSGCPIGKVWPDMMPSAKLRVAGGIGRLIAAQHALPVNASTALERDWPRFFESQSATAADRQRSNGLPEEIAGQIPGYLHRAEGGARPPARPVLLHADITHEHILLSESHGDWKISGYLDFGDAFIGPRGYELPAPGLLIMRGEPEPLRALIEASCAAAGESGPELRRRLMAHTLLHRYADIEWIRHWIPGGGDARDLGALAEVFWPVG
ncbi:MAG: hypothetical protein CME06_15295 [Gemmatimonadetes bacterium]|nr:hypothetical protein [Gemmatimonadota bacterium]